MQEYELQIVNIVFCAESNTYCVIRAKSRATGLITMVYRGPAPYIGATVKAQGRWTEHARFGRQFVAVSLTTQQPTSLDGIKRFLASGNIKGVGKTMAERIVDHFGSETLKVLEEAPQRLLEVEGVGRKKLEDIITSYSDMSDLRELMVFLEEHGISSSLAPRIRAKYGQTALVRIKNNPYGLMHDVAGIGFKTADRIALSLGLEPEDSQRIQAGLAYVLIKAGEEGHTCLPEEELLHETGKVLGVDYIDVSHVYRELKEQDLVRSEEAGGITYAYAEYLYKAERGVAVRLLELRDHVNELWQVDYSAVLSTYQEEEGIKLAPEQAQALRATVEHGVFVLTGGPGTGKTTVVKGIISVLEEAGVRIALGAPTGRAAKRLSESTGYEALTIHRLLEYVPSDNGAGGIFARNEDNPLDADAIIIDEASMMDIQLMYAFLAAVPLGARLIFVGDVDQLPSVGPGNVLQDIIRSGVMPVVRLENIFRQSGRNAIVVNAHYINQGRIPDFSLGNEFAMQEFATEEETADFIVATYAQLTRSAEDWQQVQVLTPMHRGSCGVQNLNKLMQRILNPPAPNKPEIVKGEVIYRQGDKVMQVKNNYEFNVYNGDIGVITCVKDKQLVVSYPGRSEEEDVTYNTDILDELQLAYAMTVHKSQGCEYKTVLLALLNSHYIMLQRNLLYTAVTRARRNVLIAGQRTALVRAVENDKMRKRFSLLAERLASEG